MAARGARRKAVPDRSLLTNACEQWEPWRTVSGAVLAAGAASGVFWRAAARQDAVSTALLTFASVAGFCWTHLAPCGPGVPPPVPGPLPEGAWLALTFDDGPRDPETHQVLDALAAAGAHATFFVLGTQARAHPELIRRIVVEGHAIGIHGETHTPLFFCSAGRLRRILTAAQAAIHAAVPGAQARFFRPPWGLRRPGLRLLLHRHHLHLALWNLDSRDYASANPVTTAARVLRLAHPGSVVLLHDGGPGAAVTPRMLPDLLAGLADQGLRCLSLDELTAAHHR